MTTPRKHAELAIKYYSDDKIRCWFWNARENRWDEADYPFFSEKYIFFVGKTAPTEPPKIMCELAWVEFPMPESSIPDKYYDRYWVPNPADPDAPFYAYWGDEPEDDQIRLNNMCVHLNRSAAIKHGKALAAATKAAIEKAKGD